MNAMHFTTGRPPKCAASSAQRGVSLIFALIAVLVMLIAAVAIVRSFNTSLSQAGNLAFKRDLTNQSERAVQALFTQMSTLGALANETALTTDSRDANYSASLLATNAQGIPNALLNEGLSTDTTNKNTFFGVGVPARDIALSDPNGTSYGRVRYVIDRLCTGPGSAATLGSSQCIYATSTDNNLTDSSRLISAERSTSGGVGATSQPVVYRLSILVTGTRGTQGFYQATFAR
jgi:type IV pilus assembly protein PilX